MSNIQVSREEKGNQQEVTEITLKSAVETKILTAEAQRSQRNAEKSLCFGTLQGIFHGDSISPIG